MRSFESREDYLEAILVLQNEKGAVRSIDIAAKLGFTKPSVSRAMGLLRGAEYITVDRDGFIRLTETGRAAAEGVYERHRLLTDCLIRLGVSPETAAEDACRVEHVISAESFEKIKEYAARIPEKQLRKVNPKPLSLARESGFFWRLCAAKQSMRPHEPERHTAWSPSARRCVKNSSTAAVFARLTGTTARNGLRAQDVPAKTPEDNPRRKAAKRQARP